MRWVAWVKSRTQGEDSTRFGTLLEFILKVFGAFFRHAVARELGEVRIVIPHRLQLFLILPVAVALVTKPRVVFPCTRQGAPNVLYKIIRIEINAAREFLDRYPWTEIVKIDVTEAPRQQVADLM